MDTIIIYVLVGMLAYGAFHFFRNKQKGGVREAVIESMADTNTREQYATDQSAFKIVPKKVFYPKSVAEVAEIVEMARKEGVSVTVRAGGTCMSGGPLNAGLIIDMTKHMHSVHVDAETMTATVEAGAYFKDIESEAAKHGLIFAPYPSSHLICGIGGMLGNNASGEKSLRNGATSDNVLALEAVLADGTVRQINTKEVDQVSDDIEKRILALHATHGEGAKRATGEVKKAASGYRLEKVVHEGVFSEIPLFVGAQGTLGIITKAVLKLIPAPQHTELVVVSGQSLADISPIIEMIRKYNPEGLETFDGNTYVKAKEYLTEATQKLAPYIDESAHLFILAQFSESTQEETHAQAVQCLEALTSSGYNARHITNPDDVAGAWQVRRNSFTLMRDHNEPNHKAVPCIEDVIIPLSALGEFVSELIVILKKRCVHYGYHGHIGDGSLRIIPVFDFSAPNVSDEIVGLMRDVFEMVKRLKGNISADHSDGIIRTPFLKEFYGEDLYRVFEEIKNIYDPENIMNPGKKVGGTLAFMKDSLNK